MKQIKMKVTDHQIVIIHTLLPIQIKKNKKLKASLVYQFTNDKKKTSTKDLSFAQAQSLIYYLQTGKEPTNKDYAVFDAKNYKHKYILSLCHQLGWEEYNSQRHKMYADLEKLGSWIRKYGYLHKPLITYSDSELSKLISQLENVAKSEYSKIKS